MDAKKGGLGLVKSRRFGPLFATQFLGAFNDNVFKTALFVMIGFYGLGQNGVLPAGQMLNLGALLFILPYFLFSALSGQLGNKFDKAVLARWVKVLEIIIMAVAAYGFYIRSAPLLLLCLFCMGAQSTLFGPLKYAILPDYLDDNELMMGNSLIESGTFVAIPVWSDFGNGGCRRAALYCRDTGFAGRRRRNGRQPVYAVRTRQGCRYPNRVEYCPWYKIPAA